MTTGFIYDPLFEEHDAGPGHPERPERLRAALDLLAESGLADALTPIATRDATFEELTLVHHPSVVATVHTASASGAASLDADTHAGPRTYDAALRAAGGAIAAVDAVLDGAVDNAFALLRPPGHHATPSRAMGFCFFNNVAIAAAYALGRAAERIAIVDIDVHHGNGTQDAFYADPRVLYISTHQWPLYPGSGSVEETGTGDGAGTTLNLPLPPGSGDATYERAFEYIILPALRRYRPELLLVSAGFDAHFADPLASMRLSNAGYARLAMMLVAAANELCDGHAIFALEGGYDLTAVAWGVRNGIEALLGRAATPDPLGAAPSAPEPDIEALLARARSLHEL